MQRSLGNIFETLRVVPESPHQGPIKGSISGFPPIVRGSFTIFMKAKDIPENYASDVESTPTKGEMVSI